MRKFKWSWIFFSTIFFLDLIVVIVLTYSSRQGFHWHHLPSVVKALGIFWAAWQAYPVNVVLQFLSVRPGQDGGLGMETDIFLGLTIIFGCSIGLIVGCFIDLLIHRNIQKH